MNKYKFGVWVIVGFFLSGCAQMTYKQKAGLTGAVICGTAGGAAGAAIGHQDNRNDEGKGAAIGAVTGALVCGTLAYLLAEEPKPPAPKPAPPAPPPSPPAPRPTPPPPPAPPPPPPPPVKPQVERTIILDNVLFDFDKTAIKPDGAKILDRLVAFMNENRDKRVDLEGHTDSVGTDKYNQRLSERRAASVKDYLVKHGVDASRISTQGFGESKPIADNKTADGRAKNRRVEVKVR